ncbi:hypothetical protein GF340_01560 [Candidatus Peregrinibacteria bacterium]|nr:hypothetical protein [Candidatus Peregrinibacteria bacterium]
MQAALRKKNLITTMSEDNFHYRPLNQSKRPKKSGIKLPKFPQFGKGNKPNWKQILIWLALLAGGGFLLAVILFILMIAIVSIGLPDVNDLDKLGVAESTTIYDREGGILYVKHGGENRKYVAYNQISEHIVDATVSIEDDQYWKHSGFDPIGIMRALVNNTLNLGPQQGGSTLTQQYIKNAFLTNEKTYMRKVKELILALRLEREFNKEEIMELYLNKIPYGNNAFGVEKASQVYFDKPAAELDVAEAAILASLPKAPTYYNPYGQHKYSQLTKTFETNEIESRNIQSEADLKDNEFLRGLIGQNISLNDNREIYIQGRTDLVLRAMEDNGYITAEEKKAALDKLQNLEFNEYKDTIQNPHFVFYVIEKLEEKYGKEIVERGGLQVYTTLDPNLQNAAVSAIEEGAERNTANYNAKNAGLISLDPNTGEILAMVGSKDYFAEDIDGAVNVTTQFRQPGSSFKPIVFAETFYNRHAPGSIIFDAKTSFGGTYPNNYDGNFMGPMSIRKALGQSRNIPAIKGYFLAGEQEEIIGLAEKMGIEFLDPTLDYGWPLALGTAEAKPIDMAGAFGVFANNGIYHEPFAIRKVENTDGEVLEEWDAENATGEEALDPQIAYLITDILSDTSVNIGESLTIPGHRVAAKTGTSNIKEGNTTLPRDLWTIGYSPQIVTAVWAGNNKASDGKLYATASGYGAATPIWRNYMIAAHSNIPAEDFEVPEGITRVAISKLTGKLPGPSTPEDQITEEVFASFSVPTEVDPGSVSVDIDTRNNQLANEYCPPALVEQVTYLTITDIADYPNWVEGANSWLEANKDALAEQYSNVFFGSPPEEESNLCTEEALEDAPEIRIDDPDNNDTYTIGENLKVRVSVDAPNDVEKVEFFLDDVLKNIARESPYSGIIRMPKNEESGQSHTLSVTVTDTLGYTDDAEIIITGDSETSTDTGENDNTEAETEPELEVNDLERIRSEATI